MKKVVFVVLSILLFQACEKKGTHPEIVRGEALGTTYQIKYFSEEDIELETALDSIFEKINASMSTYQDESDIARINAGDTTVQVDENFREVFQYSQQIFEESGGYFDPSVGILVNAYGFGPEKPFQELDSASLDSLKAFVGFGKLQLSEDNYIQKENPEIYLDFNAIAKGFTLDVIARYLEQQSVDHYLIELGGELVAKGQNLAKKSDWLVAIDDPGQQKGYRTFTTVLALKDRAMATSGNYRKYRVDTVTGERFVHTVNPITGEAQKSDLLSASVLAENCTLADGYATAFMALGFERSIEMLEELDNVDVYFIYSGENNEISVYASEGFEQALRD